MLTSGLKNRAPTKSGGHANLFGNIKFMQVDGFATLRARRFTPVHPLRVFSVTNTLWLAPSGTQATASVLAIGFLSS